MLYKLLLRVIGVNYKMENLNEELEVVTQYYK